MSSRMVVLVCFLTLLVRGEEVFSSQSFRRNGAKINLSAKVQDINGNPVPDANVLFLFKTGRGKSTILRKTDTNGSASAEGHANLYTTVRVSKDNFYQSDATLRFSNLNNAQAIMDEITQWESVPILLILKEKRHPCIGRRHIVSLHDIPTNVWMTFNLDEGKIQPKEAFQIGLGLEMRVWNINDSSFQNEIRTMLELRSVGENTGFLVNDDGTQSRFRFPYEAPISGYKSPLLIGNPAQITDERKALFLGDDNDGKQLVFRLQNNRQNVVSYHYGMFIKLVPGFDMKASSAWIHAIYYVNPVDDDRNTEYQYP